MQVEMQPSINKPFVLIQKQIWQFSVKLCKKSSKRGIFRAFWNHIKNQHFLILPSLCIDENWFFLLGLNNTSAKIIAKNLSGSCILVVRNSNLAEEMYVLATRYHNEKLQLVYDWKNEWLYLAFTFTSIFILFQFHNLDYQYDETINEWKNPELISLW